MIELDLEELCAESQEQKHAMGISQRDQDCHPFAVSPMSPALLLPPTTQDPAGLGSSAGWTPISHGQVAAYGSLVRSLGLGQQDVFLTQTSPAEPLGLYQLVLALYAGAAMLPATASDAHEMVAILAEHKVTICVVTADELQDWLHAGLSSQV